MFYPSAAQAKFARTFTQGRGACTQERFALDMVLNLLAVGAAALLTPPRPGRQACRHGEVRMGMFDGLAAAFANDETLSKRTAATQTLRTITWRDPKGKIVTSQALPGQKLKDIAREDGITPIKYNCNEGTCKSCDVLCNGDRIPVCVARMPDWDVEIAWGLKGSKQMGLDRQEQPSTRQIPEAKPPAFETPDPFGGGEPEGRVVPSQQAPSAEEEEAPKKLSLAERIMAEEAAKKAKKKGFFG